MEKANMEKGLPVAHPVSSPHNNTSSPRKPLWPFILLFLAGVSLFTKLQFALDEDERMLLAAGFVGKSLCGKMGKPLVAPQREGNLVQLEAHIMSKCPDARDCLHDLIVPAMSQVFSKVNFTLSYIGRPTDPDDGVACMHGPTECLGNILELCAADIYPDPKSYLGFANCLTGDYQHIPDRDLVHDCAMEYGLDFQRINECASRDDGYGMHLLRSSVERSAALNVSTSCTVRLEGKTRCVRDGGRWKDCEGGSNVKDLVADIEQVWHDKNS